MITKGGGWTVIQKRVDGSTDFNRTWNEYKEGFGSVNSSYWLGNDVIHLLTKHKPSLYVSITLTNGTTLYQQYEEFSITDETDNYRLYLNGPTTGTLEKIHLIDCKHLLAVGFSVSSVYTIYPWYNRSVDVFCDMKRKDGGWTVKHRRIDGSTDFLRNWNEYKEGFGSVNSSYWIGNDVIHQLTKISSSLYVSITLTNGTTLYQQYEEFSVTDEKDNYRLYLAGPTEGTLGDSMLDVGDPYLNLSGMSFTTYDRDNDEHNDNCAIVYDGGWWFNYCHTAFLNGPWCDPGWYKPLWPTVIDGSEIKETVMMIKTR
ncbi:fibroleukin-like [Saccostrea cucullata]|uniref:fibroleukin-like n=1 Tax=Saccostrea cuccullata TaxID=36930 RepID=UPI002ED0E295